MDDVMFAAILVATIAGFVDLDSTATWQFMISQPIVSAPLTGIFLGYAFSAVPQCLKLGLMVGTILQLLWIEQLPLGMNVPPDAALAALLSVGLGYTAGRSYETYVEREVCYTVAILISVALGVVGRNMDIFIRRLNTIIEQWVNKKVAEGWLYAVSIGHTLGGVLTFCKAFVFCFFVVWLGTEPLRYFISSLNFQQNTGFIVIQGLLPAVGFAVLANKYLLDYKDLKRLLVGIAIFTILPASIWFALGAAIVWGWFFSKEIWSNA